MTAAKIKTKDYYLPETQVLAISFISSYSLSVGPTAPNVALACGQVFLGIATTILFPNPKDQ